MKFLSTLVFLGLFASTVSSIPIARRDVNEALIPQFGFSSGVNPTGTFPPPNCVVSMHTDALT